MGALMNRIVSTGPPGMGEDECHVQLSGLTEEDAPVAAHQLLGGLRVEA